MIRVLILAATEAQAAGLAELLAEDERIELVTADEPTPDVLLVSGRALPRIPRNVTAVVTLGNDFLGPLDYRNGVRAQLPLSATAAEVLAAVLAAAQDLVVLTPAQAEMLLRPLAAAPAEPLIEALTNRELQVLRCMAQGLGNKEIANLLGISEYTAKFHVASILGKLQAATRTEAVTQGIRRGLIPI